MPSDLEALKTMRADFVVAKDEAQSTDENEVIAARWDGGARGRAIVLPAGASEEERERQLATLYASCKRRIEAEDGVVGVRNAGVKEEVRK